MKTGYSLKEHSASIVIALRTLDAIAILTAGFFCFWLRFSHLHLDNNYKSIFLIGVLFSALSLSGFGAYRAWRGISFRTEIKCVTTAIVSSFILLILSTFFTQSSDWFSRIWMLAWPMASIILILSYRLALRKTLGGLRSKGWNIRRVIIIGDGELAQEVANKITKNPEMGLVVQGYVSDQDSIEKNICIHKIPHLGNLDNLDDIVLEKHIDQVWIALPMYEIEQMKKVQKVLATTSVTIRMVPDIFGFQLLNHSMTEVAGLPIINLSASHMLEGKNRFIKSIEDKLLSSVILLGISPVLLIVAIGVKLSSPGPIFYRQERVSWNGRPFDMLKFRSMAVDSEKDGVKWGGATSMSVTKFGAFIRKTSLDELPQFINVLKGDMSIVGPRPERTIFVDQFKHEIPGYMKKHMVKAGITGWAQINGWRGDTDLEKRIECDLYYIEHWSLWLDLNIIFLTIWKGFIHKNAA